MKIEPDQVNYYYFYLNMLNQHIMTKLVRNKNPLWVEANKKEIKTSLITKLEKFLYLRQEGHS